LTLEKELIQPINSDSLLKGYIKFLRETE